MILEIVSCDKLGVEGKGQEISAIRRNKFSGRKKSDSEIINQLLPVASQ